MPDLRELLEARTATPVGFAADGESVYVLCDLSGTFQLYRVATAGGELVQLTDLADPVSAYPIPRRRELVVSVDAGGNEREQLYVHSGEPSAALRPLVVEPDFLHREPHLSRDGTLLAYSCNRRNGTDLDVYVRALDTGGERLVFDRGGMCTAAGFSPDDRLLAVTRPTERSGDEELWLFELESGDAVCVTPHEGEAEYARRSGCPAAPSSAPRTRRAKRSRSGAMTSSRAAGRPCWSRAGTSLAGSIPAARCCWWRRTQTAIRGSSSATRKRSSFGASSRFRAAACSEYRTRSRASRPTADASRTSSRPPSSPATSGSPRWPRARRDA
jgi:hypothetical protein